VRRRFGGWRYSTLWVGLAVTSLALLLALTPWSYEIERRLWGVPDEYYPELMWATVAVFIGAPLIAVGVAIILLTRKRD